MARDPAQDTAFEIAFFESVLRRDVRSTEIIELLAGLYPQVGRLSDGLKMDRRLVRLQPANPTAHYNLACSLALTRRRTAAIRSLRHAVELGYTDFDWMSQDPDLEALNQLPAFVALLDRLKPQS